jgi:hypothetical protein
LRRKTQIAAVGAAIIKVSSLRDFLPGAFVDYFVAGLIPMCVRNKKEEKKER